MRIPKDWSEITVGQYSQLYKTFRKDYINPVDKIHEQFVILSGVDPKDAWAIETKTLIRFNKATEFINHPIPSTGHLQKRFKIGDNWYEFQTDARKINGGQYMSAMDLQTDIHRVNENLHLALFNIAKPIKRNWLGKFKDEKIDNYELYFENRIEDFKQIPVSIAYPIVVFFSLLSKNLIDFMQDYSVNQLQKMREKVDEELEALMLGSEH